MLPHSHRFLSTFHLLSQILLPRNGWKSEDGLGEKQLLAQLDQKKKVPCWVYAYIRIICIHIVGVSVLRETADSIFQS